MRDPCEPSWREGHPETLALESEVGGLPLTTKEIRALAALQVRTVREFLEADLDQVRHLRGFGAVTYARLQESREAMRRKFPCRPCRGQIAPEGEETKETKSAVRQAAESPVTKGAWRLLPLFSGRSPEGTQPGDFHESYQAGLPVGALRLPRHLEQALAERKIASLGELLLTPGPALAEKSAGARRALKQAQAIVEEFLRHATNWALEGGLDASTPESFLRSLVESVVGDERHRQVLLERMGWRSEPRTLGELAQQFGLTRERIRQIENKGLKGLLHWRAYAALQPLHDRIRRALDGPSPLVRLEALGRHLQREFGWDRPLHKEAITRLLRAFPNLKCVEGRLVCPGDFRCLECPVLPAILDALLAGKPAPRGGLRRLAGQFVQQVAIREDCRRCAGGPPHASPELVWLAFTRCPPIRAQFSSEKRELQHVERWLASELSSEGPLSAMIEQVLRDHRGPLSYREVHAAVSRHRDDQVEPGAVWDLLRMRVARPRSRILLWQRGGVYQHKCHVDLDAPVFRKIEKWVVRVLREGPLAQLSTHAALQALPEDCAAAGLTSEYAIHSCLKHRQHPKLVFFHSPYVGLAGAATCRTSNVKLAEELIRREGGVVPYDALRRMLCGRMGWKNPQFQEIVKRSAKVIRTKKGFLHVDHFDAASPAFAALREHVGLTLAREGPVSAERIYGEKGDLCRQLGIDGPRMLHSALRLCAPETIARSPYPLLTLHVHGGPHRPDQRSAGGRS